MSVSPHPYKSERTDIFVGTETEQKSEAAVTRYPGFLTGSQQVADPEVEWIEERVVGGNREVFQHVEGPRSFDGGNWTVVPFDGWPISWLLGSETANTDTTDVEPKMDGAPPTATVEANFYGGTQDDFSRAFVGVAPDSGDIQVNNEEELEISLSTQALGLTADTLDGTRTPTTGISLSQAQPWTFKSAASNLTVFGTTFARVEDFQLSINNNINVERYIESDEAPEPYEVLYGNIDYTLDLDIAITDDSLFQEVVNPTSGGFAVDAVFEKPGGDQLSLSVGEARMENADHEIPDDGKITVSPSIVPRTVSATVPGGPYL